MHVHTHDLITATNKISPTMCLSLIHLHFSVRTNEIYYFLRYTFFSTLAAFAKREIKFK